MNQAVETDALAAHGVERLRGQARRRPADDALEIGARHDLVDVDALEDLVHIDPGDETIEVDSIHDGVQIDPVQQGVDVDPPQDAVEVQLVHHGVKVNALDDFVHVDGVEGEGDHRASDVLGDAFHGRADPAGHGT